MVQLAAAPDAGKRRLWWPVALGSVVVGATLGVVGVLALPAIIGDDDEPPALPAPAKHVGGSERDGSPKLGGDLYTTIKGFTLEDPEGNTVLKVAEIGGFVDLDAVGDHLIRMPRGRAEDVELWLRRGPSGRVSLSEAFRGDSEPSEPKKKRGGTALQIGPLSVKNVKMTVDMGKTPVIIHVDQAVVRIQRKLSDLAPKIFLTAIHGHMVSPDPLPQPIAIEGGEGAVDLAGDPLVDLRTRVCIGDSEMRVRIEMAERREQVRMTVDANGALAKSALVALNVVSKLKPDKIGVSTGAVTVEEKFECSRSEGRDRRKDMDRGKNHETATPAKEQKAQRSKPIEP